MSTNDYSPPSSFPQHPDPPVTWPDRERFDKRVEEVIIRPGETVAAQTVAHYRTWCPRCGRRFESDTPRALASDVRWHKAVTCHPVLWDDVPADD